MYPVQSKVQLNPPITPPPYFNKKKEIDKSQQTFAFFVDNGKGIREVDELVWEETRAVQNREGRLPVRGSEGENQ